MWTINLENITFIKITINMIIYYKMTSNTEE